MCIIFAILALLIFAAPAVADPVLGVADDSVLLRTSAPADNLLALAQAHNAGELRLIAYLGRDDDRIVQIAGAAAARGMSVHVALTASDFSAATPATLAAQAGALAGRLSSVPRLTLSILNEPDLVLPAPADCDPQTVQRLLRTAGYKVRRTHKRVKRTKIVRKRMRRHHKWVRVRRRVVVYRTVYRHVRRHGKRVRVKHRIPRYRIRTRTIVSPTSSTTIQTDTVGPQATCLEIQRARVAASYYRAMIPAVRASAPAARIDVGETSPVSGVQQFYAELGRLSLPAFDGVAHHPYVHLDDGRGVDGPAGALTGRNLPDLARLVRTLWPGVAIDLSEFGVDASIRDDERVNIWRGVYAGACAIGARTLVAYQWMPRDDAGWNTGVLDRDGGETVLSRTLTGLHC